MKKLLLLSLVLLMSVFNVTAKDRTPVIYGNIIYLNSFQNTYDDRMGVYSFPASKDNFALTPLVTSVNFDATGNGIMDGKNYYFLVSDSYDGEDYTQLYNYDMETWKLVKKPVDVDNTLCANDFTIDPTTGKVYGLCASWSGSNELCELDFNAPERKSLGVVDSTYYTLAADAKGDLYAISAKGNLVKLSKAGVPTFVGSLNLSKDGLELYNRVQSATFDPVTGLMYWAAQLWDNKNSQLISALYSVDTKTSTATKIVDFPENAQIVSLYIPTPAAADDAPAKPTSISKEFEAGALSGNILFTAPTTTYGGGTLTGDLAYEISVDGKQLATGMTTAGAEVKTPVTVEKEGMTRFEITVSNAAGKGESAIWRSYIGYDETSAPTHVSVNVNDDNAEVSWSAPDSTLHKGYFDPDKLSYNVYIYNGDSKKLVAENVSDKKASVALSLDGYAKYHFGVVANNGSHVSAEGKSNDFAFGPAIDVTEDKPYNETFDTSDAFKAYTSIDANGDKHYEEYPDYGYFIKYAYWDYASYEKALQYSPNSLHAADDWVLTPRFNLKKDQTYKLTFNVWRLNKKNDEKFQVAYGKGYDPSAYENISEVFNPDTLAGKAKTATTYSFDIKPAEDGAYMIGFHDFSDASNSYYILLDNISLSLLPVDAIKGVKNFETGTYFDVYTASGILVSKQAIDLSGLPKGLYIVNGKKLIIK